MTHIDFQKIEKERKRLRETISRKVDRSLILEEIEKIEEVICCFTHAIENRSYYLGDIPCSIHGGRILFSPRGKAYSHADQLNTASLYKIAIHLPEFLNQLTDIVEHLDSL